jgi:hypothetical protein
MRHGKDIVKWGGQRAPFNEDRISAGTNIIAAIKVSIT